MSLTEVQASTYDAVFDELTRLDQCLTNGIKSCVGRELMSTSEAADIWLDLMNVRQRVQDRLEEIVCDQLLSG